MIILMQLNIVNQAKIPIASANQNPVRVSGKKLQLKFDQILKILTTKRVRNKSRLKAQELTIVFLTPAAMKKINFKYRKKNKPTDVLSFTGYDQESIGELLMCPAVLQRQAKDYGHSYEQELLTMLIHGLLHLLGYDHELSKSEEKVMFTLQDFVLQSLLTKTRK